MKNLKKSLALIMAMVLVFGLCTIGAGAAFGDQDAIVEDYTTAVGVMSGMGILKGDDNDGDGVYDFRPNDSVTRAEAAKMITYMILGEETAEKLPARDVLDVPASAWESKYVSYLYNAGIIAGMGDGTFNSKGEVTANQYAKMLLCACGYGQEGEYVGKGWDVNVFVDAIDTIYSGADVADFGAPATRQEAAYYTFMAMTEIKQVKYTEANGYTEGKSTCADAKYDYAEMTGIVESTADTNGTDYAVIDGEDFAIELDKELIGHKVAVYYSDAAAKDGSYTAYFVEDLSSEVSVDTTVKALSKALGKNYAAEYTYWANYAEVDNTTNKGIDWATLAETKGSKNAYDYTVDGSSAGIYILDEKDNVIGYKTAGYAVGEVKKIAKADGSITISISGKSQTFENSDELDEIVEYDDIAKGDMVECVKTGDIITVTKLDMVADVEVTRYSSVKGTINNTYEKSLTNSGSYGDTVKAGNVYDLYIASDGKWAYAKAKGESVYDWFVLTATGKDKEDDFYYAEGVNNEGKIVTYRLLDEAAKLEVDELIQDGIDRMYRYGAGNSANEISPRRLICSVSKPKTDDDGNEYYEIQNYVGRTGNMPGYAFSTVPVDMSTIGLTIRGAETDTTYTTGTADPTKAGSLERGVQLKGVYNITADTKFFIVGYDKAKKKTLVSAATATDGVTSTPISFFATAVPNSTSRYTVDYVFINRDTGVAAPLNDSYQNSFYSIGLGDTGIAGADIIDEDYWTYVVDQYEDYWYLNGAFIDGEWEDDIALKFTDSSEGAKGWFADGTVDGTAVKYLKQGFYTYVYDMDDDSYQLAYTDADGVYVKSFSDNPAGYTAAKGTGYTVFLDNLKVIDRNGDGLLVDLEKNAAVAYGSYIITPAGRYYNMANHDTTKQYVSTIEALVSPDNYDENIVDLTGNGIEYVEEIVDLFAEGYKVYVSFHYWCAGAQCCSPLYITAIIPPAV